jgi:hypothetical protein
MNFIDQFRGVSQVSFIVRSPEQLEKVADGKCIGPKISLVILRRLTQASSHGEFRHQSRGRGTVRDHFAIMSTMWGCATAAWEIAARQASSLYS